MYVCILNSIVVLVAVVVIMFFFFSILQISKYYFVSEMSTVYVHMYINPYRNKNLYTFF